MVITTNKLNKQVINFGRSKKSFCGLCKKKPERGSQKFSQI